MPKLHWRRPVSSRPRPARPALFSGPLILLFVTPALASTASPRFQAEFMRQPPGQASGAGALALQALAAQEPLVAGRYRVQVMLNDSPLDNREIDIGNSDGQGLQACVSGGLLRDLDLREEALEQPLPSDDRCLDIATLIPQARAHFDPSNLRLSLSIPQVALRRQQSGSVAESRWDGPDPANSRRPSITVRYANHRHTGPSIGRGRASRAGIGGDG